MSNDTIHLIDRNILPWEKINHRSWQKKVFVGLSDTLTQLTQFAYGELQPSQLCSSHKHPTMEVFFYFLDGIANYAIAGTEHYIRPATFIRIPADTIHHLECHDTSNLRFVYFGVAL